MVTLVLLPGMDGTGELFGPFIEALGHNVEAQVVRYPFAYASYAELKRFVREQLPRGKPFLLLGESFSGPIAISIAASRPKELVGLVLCCTFARCPVPHVSRLGAVASALPIKWVPQWAINALLLGRFSTRKLRAAFSAALSQVPVSTLQERVRSVLSVDVSAQLAKIAVPVVYLRASSDRVVSAAASRHIAGVLPGVRVISMDAPHFLLQARPKEAAAIVCALAQEVEASFTHSNLSAAALPPG